MSSRICFVGAGAMGSAAIRGLLKNEIYEASQVVACDVSSEIRARVESELGVLATGNLADERLIGEQPRFGHAHRHNGHRGKTWCDLLDCAIDLL